MGDSESNGSASFDEGIAEVRERVAAVDAALAALKAHPLISPLATRQVVIRVIDGQAPGYVQIDPADVTKEVRLSSTDQVIFKNEATTKATLRLPIGPFLKLADVDLPAGGKVELTLNKKFTSADTNAEFTFEYGVVPAGAGAGPNIIVRP